MDLKDFTKQTLIQIVTATKEVNDELDATEAYVPNNDVGKNGGIYLKRYIAQGNIIDVEFDVAVTAIESEDKEGGGKLKVMSFVEMGGGANSKVENQTVSRVKYTLPLILGGKK